MEKIYLAKVALTEKAREVKKYGVKRLVDNKGDGIDMLIKILIGIVVGGLVLTLIVALLNMFFPEIQQKLMDLLNFDGTSTPAGGGGTPTPGP